MITVTIMVTCMWLQLWLWAMARYCKFQPTVRARVVQADLSVCFKIYFATVHMSLYRLNSPWLSTDEKVSSRQYHRICRGKESPNKACAHNYFNMADNILKRSSTFYCALAGKREPNRGLVWIWSPSTSRSTAFLHLRIPVKPAQSFIQFMTIICFVHNFQAFDNIIWV